MSVCVQSDSHDVVAVGAEVEIVYLLSMRASSFELECLEVLSLYQFHEIELRIERLRVSSQEDSRLGSVWPPMSFCYCESDRVGVVDRKQILHLVSAGQLASHFVYQAADGVCLLTSRFRIERPYKRLVLQGRLRVGRVAEWYSEEDYTCVPKGSNAEIIFPTRQKVRVVQAGDTAELVVLASRLQKTAALNGLPLLSLACSARKCFDITRKVCERRRPLVHIQQKSLAASERMQVRASEVTFADVSREMCNTPVVLH